MAKKRDWQTIRGRAVRETRYPGVWETRDGRFWVRGRVADPRTGRMRERHRVVEAESAHQAAAVLEQLLAQVHSGTARPPRQRFSEFAASTMELKVATERICSVAGRQKWAGILELHLFPAFGDAYLDAITRQDVEEWLARAAMSDYAAATVNSWLAVLKTICARAAALGLVERDPARHVEPLDEDGGYDLDDPNSLRPEHVGPFLDAFRRMYPQHWAFVLLGVTTGLRPSSLRPLRRQGPDRDVRWTEGLLLIRQSNSRGQHVMQRTKTRKNQIIAMPPRIVDALRLHCTWLTEVQRGSDLLFPGSHGLLRSTTCLDKPFRRVCAALELPYRVTPRGMRRTASDLTRAAGLDALVKRSIIGHTTEAMQELYATIAPDEQRRALDSVLDVVAGKSSVRL